MKKALAVSVFMCLALAMLGALGSKETGTYPNGPVSVIVPYGAGGRNRFGMPCSCGCGKRCVSCRYCS